METLTEDRYGAPGHRRRRWCAGEDGTYPVVNPAHPDQVVLAAPAASPRQLDAGGGGGPLRPAGMGGPRLRRPGWHACSRRLRPGPRRPSTWRPPSALLTREHGKVLVESLFDLATTAGMVGRAGPAGGRVARGPPQAGTSVVERVPHGVVAAILPFNWPAAVMGNKILPALLAGNTVVVKAPPTCPGAVLALAGAIAVGLPPGVLTR